VDSPIREQIKLSDRWHAHRLSEHEAMVFIPGPWGGKQVVLINDSKTVSEVELAPGRWHQLTTIDGDLSAIRLVASNPLHIVNLDATAASPTSLSVRVILSETAAAEPLLNLFVTLTAPDGAQLASRAVTIERSTRDLSVALPCSRPLSGTYRLKAALCADKSVIDNARAEVTV
jgi:hypothetical protein